MKNQLSWGEWFETHMNTEMQPEEAVMSKESLDLLSVPIASPARNEKKPEGRMLLPAEDIPEMRQKIASSLGIPEQFLKSSPNSVMALANMFASVVKAERLKHSLMNSPLISAQDSHVEKGNLVSVCPYCGAGCYVAPADDPDLCDEVHVTCDHCAGVFRAST